MAALAFPVGPLLSHGYNEACSEECNEYYCPEEHLRENKEKLKNNPLKN